MLKEIFVQSYYPQVKEAGIKYGINPVVLLAQIAIETGWGESVLCKEHFNFGGLTSFGKPSEFWPGTKVQLCEKGLTYRSYPDARSGILDMARLLRSSEFLDLDRRVADHIQQRLVVPDVRFERCDVDVADQHGVAREGLFALRPFCELIEESELVLEFRVDRGVRFVAAGGHVEIV